MSGARTRSSARSWRRAGSIASSGPSDRVQQAPALPSASPEEKVMVHPKFNGGNGLLKARDLQLAASGPRRSDTAPTTARSPQALVAKEIKRLGSDMNARRLAGR